MDEWVRWTLLAAQAMLLGITVTICVQYMRAWTPGKRGLLPLHVWLVTLSYDLMLAELTIDNMMRYESGHPLTWRAWLVIPAVVAGYVAMWAVFQLGKNRTRVFTNVQ